jgi:AraC family transcriptional activator FtrA
MIDIVHHNAAISHSRQPEGETLAARQSISVAVVVYDGVTPFELGIACDIFGANSQRSASGASLYRLSVCAATSDPVSVAGRFQMMAPFGLEKLRRADTVIVLPTDRSSRVPVEVITELRRAHVRGRRIISLCTGAFILAEAGLLEGRRATTHWAECDELARAYPDVKVDPGVLYVDEGDILTSAGSAASIDLCLHVVRQDYGSEIATRLARELVVPPQRDGGQAQFIDSPLPDPETSTLFTETMGWAQKHLTEPLTISDLANRSAMSPRTFARRFVASTGTTPHRWLQSQRVRLAQQYLETTTLPIEQVAVESGLGSAANLRKHFTRIVRTSPLAYRRAFQDRFID